MNCIIVMMVLCFLQLSYFINDTMLLNILCNFYASYDYHIYIFSLTYEADITAVGYVCLWEGKYSGYKFLHLLNSCYHMVGRSSEVTLSIFNDINTENVKDNNGFFNVSMQGINIANTSTYKELCIYP